MVGPDALCPVLSVDSVARTPVSASLRCRASDGSSELVCYSVSSVCKRRYCRPSSKHKYLSELPLHDADTRLALPCGQAISESTPPYSSSTDLMKALPVRRSSFGAAEISSGLGVGDVGVIVASGSSAGCSTKSSILAGA